MLIVTIKNLMPSFKLINGTKFYAAGIVPAKKYLNILITKGVILYFKLLTIILL